jgi:glutamate carboxypeptidase
MPRDATMIATFARAREIAAGLGLYLTEGGTGGGSDANFVAPLGVPVLDGLGAQGNGAHSEREHILLGTLSERTALIGALISLW